jgi:8-amino-7-oxononanoate synthase
MPALAEVARKKLEELAGFSRKRELFDCAREDGIYVVRNGKRLISFSCNDYLGLSHHAKVKAAAVAAIEKYGCGAGASRLVTGNHPLYGELEAKLAAWKGAEAALVFGSGYLANIGVLPALIGKGGLILADKLVHACLIDGAQISNARLIRFKHNDAEDCARLLELHRRDHTDCLIVTDEVFSMDGDVAPVAQLSKIAAAHDSWLMADGAHSLMPLQGHVDIYMGTLSKALGSYGGYICGGKDVINYLATSARSLMFSTGLPPASVAASIAALDIIRENPGLAFTPLAKAKMFTDAVGLPAAQSAIVPIILGSELKALSAAKLLEEEGFLVTAIRPPTVPENTARLRFAFSALHADEDVLKLAQIIKSKKLV